MHSAPVENREAEDSKKANKRQILFSLKIRLRQAVNDTGRRGLLLASQRWGAMPADM
jgi:hypothetical protein